MHNWRYSPPTPRFSRLPERQRPSPVPTAKTGVCAASRAKTAISGDAAITSANPIPARRRCRMRTASRGNVPPKPKTIPVPPAAKATCNAVPAKRKTPSGGVATATPPARTAPRMTAANRAHGANVLRRAQTARKRKLHQAGHRLTLVQEVQPHGLHQAARKALPQAIKPHLARTARPSTKPTPAPFAAKAGCKSAAARAVSFGDAAITRVAPTARMTFTACRNRMSNLNPENLKEYL